MARPKKVIPADVLKELYVEKGLTPAKIGLLFSCDAITVRARIKEAGILLRTKSAAQTRYNKSDFKGTDVEKAYMLGFRYGDLNVYQPGGVSETIVVRCHTTHKTQEDLFVKLFSQYGQVTPSRNKRSVHLNCFLNMSFAFLKEKYPKHIQHWLDKADDRLWSFSAGYIDAEGTFGLNQGKGRFKIDAYDKEIIARMHALFVKYGINSKLRVIAKEGENDYGWVWKRDLWRISINEAGSLEKLVIYLKPYLLHEKRVLDSQIVLTNIHTRRKNGTIK